MKRSLGISFASILSTYAVIQLHVNNACFWRTDLDINWISANYIESICYFAVPVFFMITGATLLDYRNRYSTKQFFRKRVMKVFIPFLFWTGIGILFRILVFKDTQLVDLNFAYFYNAIFHGNVISIYWFLPELCMLYLTIPILSLIPENRRYTAFWYMIAIIFSFQIAIPFFLSVLKLQGVYTPIAYGLGGSYIYYLLLGYLLSHHAPEKQRRYLIYFLGILGLSLQVFGTQWLSFEQGSVVTLMKGYQNLPTALYAPALFLFMLQSARGKFVTFVSRYQIDGFACYLMHWYLIQIIEKMRWFDLMSLPYRLFSPIFVMIICILLTRMIRHIPGGKYIVP